MIYKLIAIYFLAWLVGFILGYLMGREAR